MNDRTLAQLRSQIEAHWADEIPGSHHDWLEQLAHVHPAHARQVVDQLIEDLAPLPTAERIVELAAEIRVAERWAAAGDLEPLPDTGWVPLTPAAKVRLHPIVHTFWTLSGLIGVRDRLRCPSCTAIGTWKPYGDWVSRFKDGDRPVLRWLCKCCGRYEGPEGITRGWPRAETKVWVTEAPGFTDRDLTPLEQLRAWGFWPWK